MKLHIRQNQMEEVEGITAAFPATLHELDVHRTKVPWHWHDELEFMLVESGTMHLHTNGKAMDVPAGSGLFMNANVLAAMDADKSCVVASLLFLPVLLGGHFRSVFETKYIEPVLQNRSIEIVPIPGRTTLEKRMLKQMEKLIHLHKETDREFELRNAYSELWLDLLKQIETQTPQDLPSSRRQERLLTMMSYVQENYAEKLTLEEIASAAAVSPRECTRCFREALQETPFDYVLEVRMEAAKKRLRTSDENILEIALASGFSGNAYFSKMFKQLNGMTPRAYRTEHKTQRDRHFETQRDRHFV